MCRLPAPGCLLLRVPFKLLRSPCSCIFNPLFTWKRQSSFFLIEAGLFLKVGSYISLLLRNYSFFIPPQLAEIWNWVLNHCYVRNSCGNNTFLFTLLLSNNVVLIARTLYKTCWLIISHICSPSPEYKRDYVRHSARVWGESLSWLNISFRRVWHIVLFIRQVPAFYLNSSVVLFFWQIWEDYSCTSKTRSEG